MKKKLNSSLIIVLVLLVMACTQHRHEAANETYTCPMHPAVTADAPGTCPVCGMELVKMDAAESAHWPAGGGPIRIDPAVIQNMGVRTEAVARRDLVPEVRAPGRIQVDEGRIAVVNARVMGYAEKLYADVTGQRVAKGQPLVDLYSPDLASAQEEFLQAARYAKAAGKAAGGSELAESARRRLANWGMSPSEIEALERGGEARSVLRIAAPIPGVVLEKKVVRGQNVAPGMELYTLADLSQVWAVAQVYQSDLGAVRPGAGAEVELAYRPGKPFRGKIVFVSPVLDSAARTAEVRVALANTPGLDLKPGMIATVVLRAPARKGVLAVPEQALLALREGGYAVQTAAGQLVAVKTGLFAGGLLEISGGGIGEGLQVVTTS